MSNWKEFFKGKRVTLMGLGLLGRGRGDAIFLAEHGTELIVTDLRDEKTLAPSLAKLKKFKDIHYTLGQHKLEDFRDRDFILKAAGVPLDSPYIAEAQKQKIPIEMDASLFAKLMPKGVVLVGVTGTRGKSTTTALIYEILREGIENRELGIGNKKRNIYKGGNLVPEATLPLLEKVNPPAGGGDIVVLELDSWQLQGFHDAKISPQIAVFTTFLDDHLVYYKGDTDRYLEDKVAIFKYQKPGNLLVVGEPVAQLIGKLDIPVTGDVVVATKEDVPKDWNIAIPGEHNLENIACALQVAGHFKIPLHAVKKAVEGFKGVPGRLEFIHEVRGVKIYNDTNATTPDATIAGIQALGSRQEGPRKIILIVGGTDKGLDMSKLVEEIPKYCKGVILLKETGTDKISSKLEALSSKNFQVLKAETLKECVAEAMKLAEKGDIILFSPAFASFGKWFKNEYDRGEQFVNLVQKL
ncbi:MAG: UDP-N-acetylmuramoyl-L-alanine--D-glutamate ligase [bacterium]|nr:UDP-N-acetylmuramoyl-L-alanine--D-glutamate ligase [bacterium]